MIINITQHQATDDQQAQGVVDLSGEELSLLKELLNFDHIPTWEEVDDRAEAIVELACQNGLGGEDDDPWPNAAMIGGAPFLMAPLHGALVQKGIDPLYAFSVRESVETVQADGSVIKTAIFRHVGFVGKK